MDEVESFWIGKYEVTNQQYCEYLNSSGQDSSWGERMEIELNQVRDGYAYSVSNIRKHYPVTYVSYNDAVAYCAWLSERVNRTYRLPTEWE